MSSYRSVNSVYVAFIVCIGKKRGIFIHPKVEYIVFCKTISYQHVHVVSYVTGISATEVTSFRTLKLTFL